MLIDCRSCGHSISDSTVICPRCGHDSRQGIPDRKLHWLSPIWVALKSVGILIGALLGVPIGGPELPPRDLPKGKWRTVMITGKVVGVLGCLWAVIAYHTGHILQLWAAVPIIVVGVGAALLGRTSPQRSHGA